MKHMILTAYIRHSRVLMIGLALLTVFALVPGNVAPIVQAAEQAEPGQSLGIASVPNLRDLGGYKTKDGKTVKRGLLYRSNQLYHVSPEDMQKISKLGLKNSFDLRTFAERQPRPDEVPREVNVVWLDVLADAPGAGPAQNEKLMQDPKAANEAFGGGKADEGFKDSYRQFVSLPSAQHEFRKLFLMLGDENELPALFHCTTGKDRTGWAAAALLTLLGVPEEVVMKDYLLSNDFVIPMYQEVIDKFVEAGGEKEIPMTLLGVKESFLEAAFDEMEKNYGTIENYFTEALKIDTDGQKILKERYLTQ